MTMAERIKVHEEIVSEDNRRWEGHVEHWTLSVNRKEDKEKIEILTKRGVLVRMTTICGRPVCWEYELDGERDADGNPVVIEAWIGTGK